jgi:Domain of unknown function (DUF1998)
MRSRANRYKVGELRPSQLMFAYGIGSVVDLPGISAMVMGLDDWDVIHTTEIGEERLLAAVRSHLSAPVQRLCSPPMAPDDNGGAPHPLDPAALIGVPVAAFPRWVRCPSCSLLAPLGSGLFQLKTDPFRPDRARYVHQNCSKAKTPPTVLPARFLVACKHGHLDDFPWVSYVHRGATRCEAPVLRLYEFGVTGTARDVFVECEKCGEQRPLSDAFGEEAGDVLPPCRGRRPHLRDVDEKTCPEPMRAILLGASNSWFPLTLSALSIPMASNKLGQLVDEQWTTLEKATTRDILGAFADIGQLKAFSAYSLDEVWVAIEAKRAGTASTDDPKPQELKTPEWAVFSQPDPTRNSADFRLTRVEPPLAYAQYFEKVVLVERLREVRAMLGFTRIESPGDYGEVEIPDDQVAPLSRKPPQWVPATEVRGEGIFLQFNEIAVEKWCSEAAVLARNAVLFEAHRQWRRSRKLPDVSAGYPGIRYALLHTFSHALMRQFALECGYTAAGIRERIYSLDPQHEDGPMAGVLIYTAAPDSEGTLGGLVNLGRPETLARHLEQALEQLRLCASDPYCAEHHPYRDGISLHGGACHACLFAPETSCERGNKYLDRALLVRTFASDGIPFFDLEGTVA